MGLDHLVSNSTFPENQTDKLGVYCDLQWVGPVIWTSFTSPAACVGLPSSVWLLSVFAQRLRNGLAINIYMLNVAILDLCVNIFSLLMMLNSFLFRVDAITMVGIITNTINNTGRPLFCLCTCFDCYMAAVFPIRYMKMKHSRYRLVACTLVWALTFVLAVTYVNDYNMIFSPVVMIPFALSLSTIVFFDLSVLHALRKPDPSGRRDIHPQKEKALRTITHNLAITVVAYLPPVVVFGFSSLMHLGRLKYFCNVGAPSFIVSFLCSAMTPVLHLKKLGVLNDVKGCRGA